MIDLSRRTMFVAGARNARAEKKANFRVTYRRHAGMLALCRAKGWRSEGYRLEGHRVQRELLTMHAEAAEVVEDEIPTGVDGCGVVTFAFTIRSSR